MAALDQIIKITISQSTAAVSQPSLAVALIVGPTAPGWSDYVHSYTSPEDMLTDGFVDTDPEYIYALELYGQSVTPTNFLVGKRVPTVAQVDTITATSNAAGTFSVTLNGTVYSITTSTLEAQEVILGSLNVAIEASGLVTGVVTGSGGTAVLHLTAVNPGQVLTYSAISSNLAHVNVTPASGNIVTDLTNISGENNSWYCLLVAGGSDYDTLEAAPYIEANRKIFLPVTTTAAVATSATTDVGSVLQSSSYDRTGLIFTQLNGTDGIEAAWAGGQLPQTPGSNNWAYKSLAGIQEDVLTSTQQAILIGTPVSGTPGKNVNIYQALGGVGVTQQGTMASGQFIDVTVGIDWVYFSMQTAIFSLLVNTPKIPYTDKGTSLLISAIRAVIDQGIQNGLIDDTSPISVTAPPVLTVPANQRAKRIAPTISFSFRLAGAYNAIVVQGTVTT